MPRRHALHLCLGRARSRLDASLPLPLFLFLFLLPVVSSPRGCTADNVPLRIHQSGLPVVASPSGSAQASINGTDLYSTDINSRILSLRREKSKKEPNARHSTERTPTLLSRSSYNCRLSIVHPADNAFYRTIIHHFAHALSSLEVVQLALRTHKQLQVPRPSKRSSPQKKKTNSCENPRRTQRLDGYTA